MKDTVRYGIIENERLALAELKRMIGLLRPEWEIVFTGETVEEAIAFFRSEPDVDIIFLDIELDDGSSFDIFKSVEVNLPIIFTTAYDEFCLQAFKVNSIDYLLKPLSLEDLAQAIAKFEKGRISTVPANKLAELRNKTASRILIASGDRYSFINIEDVAWFMSEDKYVFAVTTEGKRHLISYPSLGDLEKDLDETDFFRITRKYIVRVSAIESVSKFLKGRLYCHLKAGDSAENVLIRAERRDEFLQWLGAGRKH